MKMTLTEKQLETLEREWREGVPIRRMAKDIKAAPSTAFRWIKKFEEIEQVIREEEDRKRRVEAERTRQERLQKQREQEARNFLRRKEIEALNLMMAERKEKEMTFNNMMNRGDYFVTMAHKFVRRYPTYFFSAEVDRPHEYEDAFSEFLRLLKGNRGFNADFREFCIEQMDIKKLKNDPQYWKTLVLGTYSYEKSTYNLAVEYSKLKEKTDVTRMIKFQLLHPKMFRPLERGGNETKNEVDVRELLNTLIIVKALDKI